MRTPRNVKFSESHPLKLDLESRKQLAAQYIRRKARAMNLTERQIQAAIYCAGRYLEHGHSLHRALVTALQ